MWKHCEKLFGGLREEEDGAFFGPHVAFNGELRFDGTLRVDGRLEGRIHTTGTLEVGGSGQLKGVITAGTLINGGRVVGTVIADRVLLLSSSLLVGDVHAPLLAVESGARFQGRSGPDGRGRRLEHQPLGAPSEGGVVRLRPAPALIDGTAGPSAVRPPG